ncbi:hypothetical protein ACF0H5_020042 [Mactra antiquata]
MNNTTRTTQKRQNLRVQTQQKTTRNQRCCSSNAGKTYMTKLLIPVDTIAGYDTTSREFPFGDAVYQPIILINELTIESAAKAELYKNVLEVQRVWTDKLAEIPVRVIGPYTISAESIRKRMRTKTILNKLKNDNAKLREENENKDTFLNKLKNDNAKLKEENENKDTILNK